MLKKFLTSERLIIILLVFFAFFLRIYRVDKIPPGLSWDEVSIGYNAYSILTTGKDEHQKFMPLDAFVAYGDYKPALPIYLTVPMILLFGLNELSVRLPSVISGTLAILFTYLLVKELFKANKLASLYGLLSALTLAVSPWHWQLSRAGFEANIALLFIIIGGWLTLKARERSVLLWWCWLPFVAAVYTFNSARYFAPILGLLLLIYCWNSFKKYVKRELVGGMVIALIAISPIFPHLISPQARLRFAEVNIFTDDSIVRVANERINYENRAWWARILHNRRFGYLRSYLIHYFDNFQPSYLFIRGDGNPKFSIQDNGQLYLVELPFLALGMYFLARNNSKTFWLLLFWLMSAVAPAAVARETPHALRTENTLPTWQIFISYGLVSTYQRLSQSAFKKLFLYLISLIFVFSLGYFGHNYFNHYPRLYSGEWQYGYKEAIQFIQPIKNKYDHIVLSENIGRPYMYVAFYEKTSPQKFWQEISGGFDAAGFYNVRGLGKYIFSRDLVDFTLPNALYILPPSQVPANARILTNINLLSGTPVLVIFDFL